MTGQPTPAPVEYLRSLFDDVEFSYLVVLAVELGIADLLKSGPQSVGELARATQVDVTSLGRVLRALASRGVFDDVGEHRFALNPLAEALREDAVRSVRPLALWCGSEAYRRTWGALAHSVRTGEPAFDHVYGKPFFDYLADDRTLSKIFSDVMTSGTSDDSAAIAAAHDFSAYRRVVDVAGGHGALLAAVLDRYPEPAGVLFDLPHVLDATGESLERHLGTGRLEKVAGDFSEGVPPGADAYLLKWIIHDWDDEAALRILENCRAAMTPTGRLLIVEILVPESSADAAPTRLDTTMLVFTGSRERTEHEYAALLDRAGFTLLKTTPTDSNFSILEAAPSFAAR